ncbi:MAG TPA: SDR family oxidoreductase [Fimbriimonas sp.]|nr:SDR family oxidoreductase [Fimbriimonas sp.]
MKGQWALVTGASRGVGREIAIGLADLGCNVVLHSRSRTHTGSLSETIRMKGVQAFSVGAELSDLYQVERMLTELPELDYVYNNAAMQSNYYHSPWETGADEYRSLFEVNCIAVFTICYGVIPGMITRRFGRVVNVTSGIRDQPQLAPYAVSKAAVDKFTRDFATTLEGTGVQMNLLDPGWLRTDMGGRMAPNDVSTVIPGALVPALLDDGVSGRWFSAQDYAGMSLEQALERAQAVPALN